jgi:hypothetical protein
MATVLLKDFKLHSHTRRFSLDLDSGVVTEQWFESAQQGFQDTAGFGAYAKGFWHGWRRLFVAYYTDNRTMLLRFADRTFDLGDQNLHIVRRTLFPTSFVQRFAVLQAELPLLTFTYLHYDGDEWPPQDILKFVGERTYLDIQREVYVWSASARGDPNAHTMEFAEKVNELFPFVRAESSLFTDVKD